VPELPEVETVRRDLERLFVGSRLAGATVSEGRTLQAARRHGKYLLLDWEGGEVLVAHLRMSGQLLAQDAEVPLPPHTHAVLSFAGGPQLRFVDPRTFGELFLASARAGGPGSAGLPDGLAHLGPDALGARPALLKAALANRRACLKAVLVDQRALAGIGNIYADEICFHAGLRPDRPGLSLSAPEVRRLSRSVAQVLGTAIALRGSTLADRQYRDVLGQAGGYQSRHKVYNRAGQPCLECGGDVVRRYFGARSAFLCPACQS
jgi:formamidopyrimidine-DNA glycosylase